MGREHPLGRANVGYLSEMRELAARLAEEARLADPAEFALSWHVLVTGSITNAIEGDDRAAARAKEMARTLIALHRPRETMHPFSDDETGRPFAEVDDLDLDLDDAFAQPVASGTRSGHSSHPEFPSIEAWEY